LANFALTEVAEWVAEEKHPVVDVELGEVSTTHPAGRSLTVNRRESSAGKGAAVVEVVVAGGRLVAVAFVVAVELVDEEHPVRTSPNAPAIPRTAIRFNFMGIPSGTSIAVSRDRQRCLLQPSASFQ
jgi:hypothetical protein